MTHLMFKKQRDVIFVSLFEKDRYANRKVIDPSEDKLILMHGHCKQYKLNMSNGFYIVRIYLLENMRSHVLVTDPAKSIHYQVLGFTKDLQSVCLTVRW